MTEHIELSPQYWRTTCMVCGRAQSANMENTICRTRLQTSAVVDHIATLERKLADAEAQAILLERTVREQAVVIREHEAADVIALEAIRMLRGEQ